MTIHLHYQHKCLTCGEEYLPFNEENRNCPKCGTSAGVIGWDNALANTKEVAPLIPDIVRAAVYNTRWGVFGLFSTGDYYVKMVMHALRMRAEAEIDVPKCEEDLESVSEKLLAHFGFTECEHRRPHTKAFIEAVLREAYLKPER